MRRLVRTRRLFPALPGDTPTRRLSLRLVLAIRESVSVIVGSGLVIQGLLLGAAFGVSRASFLSVREGPKHTIAA